MGVEPDEGLITLLLAVGAEVNALNPYGQSPLHLAAMYGYSTIAEMLLAAGAKVTLRNREGKFASDMAQDAELKARLALPPFFDDDTPLPPEIEDADYVPPHGECACHEHGDRECSCGHEHGDHDDCSCGCHHE